MKKEVGFSIAVPIAFPEPDTKYLESAYCKCSIGGTYEKFIGLVLVLATIVLASCANDESLFDSIVGTWKNDGTLGTTVLVLNNDNTVVRTVTLLSVVGDAKNGTWTSNSTSITITWSDNSTEAYAYTFSSDNNEMTLTSGGISTTYTRD